MKAVEFDHFIVRQEGKMQGIWPFRKAKFSVEEKVPSKNMPGHFDLEFLGIVEARNEKNAKNRALDQAIKKAEVEAGTRSN